MSTRWRRFSSSRRVNFQVERSSDGIVAGLERGQPFADLIEVGEVVGGHDLALDDGEVDLGLVQPGGVHW